MTPADLRKLLERATPQPWEDSHLTDLRHYQRGIVRAKWPDAVCDVFREADAALIVAAVNALPKLLAVVEAAEQCVESFPPNLAGRIDRLRAALAALKGRP